MRKHNYRLWLPNVDYYGSAFDKISEQDQDKIEEKLEEGMLMPTEISIDTSLPNVFLNIGSSRNSVEFSKETSKAFRDYLAKHRIHFGIKYQPELWADEIDEEK